MNSNAGLIGMVVFLLVMCGVFWFLFLNEPEITASPVERVAEQRPEEPPAPEAPAAPEEPAAPEAPEPPEEDDAPPEAPAAKAEADGASISGVVKDARGEPLATARIDAFSGDLVFNATSGPDGAFVFSDLPDGVYALSATKPTYGSARVDDVALGTGGVVLVLEDMSAVSGMVLSGAGGEPVKDFEVAIVARPPEGTDVQRLMQGLPWVWVEDEKGAFLVKGVPSDVPLLLVARAEGFAASQVLVEPVAKGRTAKGVRVLLASGGRVQGRVVSVDGEPVKGAKVFVGHRTSGQAAAESDADGRFELTTLSEEDTVLTAVHEAYVKGQCSVAPRKGSTVEAEIVLAPGGTIEGKLTKGGEPVSGQIVNVIMLGEAAGFSFRAETDKEGFYQITNVPGGDARVSVFSPSPKTHSSRTLTEELEVVAGETTVADFDLPVSDSMIEGFVTVDGNPPQEGLVSIRVAGDLGRDSFSASIEPNGHYRAENVLPGTATIRVSIVDPFGTPRQESATAEIGENEVVQQDFTFSQAAVVYGRVTGVGRGERGSVFAIEGNASWLDAASIEVLLNLHQDVAANADLPADGSYELTGLDPGTYTIIAVAIVESDDPDAVIGSRVRSAKRVVKLTAGTEQNVDLAIP